MTITENLQTRGLVLAAPMQVPAGVVLPFENIRLSGNFAYASGHLPLNADGSVAEPLGKVGANVSLEQGRYAAQQVALAMLGSLERTLGSLQRIKTWSSIFGMVNQADGFAKQPAVINGFSELILELFGPEVGAHSRAAVGVAGLPFNVPVEVSAVIEFTD